MCGIWGIFNKRGGWTSAEDLKLANWMSLLSTDRGEHSTGYCFVQKQLDTTKDGHFDAPHIIKSVGSPFSILHQKEGREALIEGNRYATQIFGHNRHATLGSIKQSNAHPFVEGDWVLVHNGTIYGGVDLPTSGVEVDSHALCLKINEVGIKEALMGIQGAFAIIAYNKRTHQTFVARNGERTLFQFSHADYCYAMSTELELEFALKKYGRFKYFPKTEETGNITPFKPHVLYQLTPKGFEEVDKVLPRPKSYYQVAPATPVNPGPAQAPFTKKVEQRITPYTQLDELYFTVDSMVGSGQNQFKYFATGDNLEDVIFYTREPHAHLLGKEGSAIPSSVLSSETGKKTYQVKFKEIYWVDDVNTPPVGTVVKTIHTCQDCAGQADEATGAIEMRQDKWICGACVADFRANCGRVLEKSILQ